MEVEEIDSHSPQQPPSKYSRLTSSGAAMNGTGDVVASTRFGRQWQNSSRIIRVSRASGGKDRHSKVWTAKGARDRRVRLSVNTAIQFYDLQDRLGYDQPSKAVEWLIKAAAEAINELPSLNDASLSNNGVELDEDRNTDTGFVQEQGQGQHHPVVKSGCSSNNSETSKGSGLSLSRNEIRVKARERARERTAKEKETTDASSNPQSSSFTQLLTAGINNNNLKQNAASPRVKNDDDGDEDLSTLQWSSSSTSTIQMADYFGTSLMGLSSSSRPNNSILQHPHVMTLLPFSATHDLQHQHQQQLPFLPDHHHHHHNHNHPSDYNLNFPISSSSTTAGLAARGTLQSNSSSSPSFLSYLQRFSTSDSGPSVPFFLGGAPIVDNQQHEHQHYPHTHQHQFNPAGLHLCYGNGSSHSKEKGKE